MKMVATIVIFIVITILIIMYQALCCGLGTQSTMMKKKKNYQGPGFTKFTDEWEPKHSSNIRKHTQKM